MNARQNKNETWRLIDTLALWTSVNTAAAAMDEALRAESWKVIRETRASLEEIIGPRGVL